MDRSFKIQCPPFDLKLSNWDSTFPHWGRTFPPSHAKRILCFALPQNADKEWLISRLHIAFHHTVQRVPFLAGSIVPFSPEEEIRPWLRRLVPQGVAHLDVKDLSGKLSFARLVEDNFPQHLLTEEICPLHKVVYVQDKPVEVCRFQANFIDGGLLLVVSIIHIVADGRGVTEITKIFAEYFRKAQSGELGYPLTTNRQVYHSDRTEIVTGNGIPGSIEAHDAWTPTATNIHSRLENIETSCRTFRIGGEALATLKNAATSTSAAPDEWISTNDAISAFIWRSIMVARHRAGFLDADKAVHIAQPVDCRAQLGLDEPYFGNAIYMTQGSLPFSDLADPETGLAAAAQIIRAQIQVATAERFRDVVGYAERTEPETQTRMKIIDEVLTGGIILTSHFKFGIHEVDFGPAFEGRHVKAFRFPARWNMAGAVIVLPRLLDGTCEFMITEQKRTVDCLIEDEIFCRFTAENKNMGESVLVNHLPPSPPPSDHDVEAASDMQESTDIPMTTNQKDCLNTTTPSTLNIITMRAPHMGTIEVIELNRPVAKNAISLQMLHQLNDEVERIHHELTIGGTRVLILASALEDIFCAGADLKQRMAMSNVEVDEFLTLLRKTLSRLAALPVPTIAAVSGAALGGGLELALCCHFRVFSSNAIVGLPETRLGIIPGAGATYRLPQIVGLSHARDLILTGRRIGALEAFSIGLCNRLVSIDQGEDSNSPGTARCRVLETAIKLATEISAGAPLAIQAAMSALSCGSAAAEKAAYASLLHTKDRHEGLLSFEEKREADFAGE